MKPAHPGSERLAAIAGLVPPGSRVVDVGTDHARLPVYLVRAGIVSTCIASDLRQGPSESARRRVAAAGLMEQIDVRTGDGLSTVLPGEVDLVLISGLGGVAMVSILADGGAVLAGVRRLVLQPQRAEDRVRLWLREQGWALIAEHLVAEGGFDYELLVAEPGDVETGYASCPLDLAHSIRVGPWLAASETARLLARWQREESQLRLLRDRLAASTSSGARVKLPAIEARFRDLQALLAGLQQLQ